MCFCHPHMQAVPTPINMLELAATCHHHHPCSQAYLGPPSAQARYEILRSGVLELARAGLIAGEGGLRHAGQQQVVGARAECIFACKKEEIRQGVAKWIAACLLALVAPVARSATLCILVVHLYCTYVHAMKRNTGQSMRACLAVILQPCRRCCVVLGPPPPKIDYSWTSYAPVVLPQLC